MGYCVFEFCLGYVDVVGDWFGGLFICGGGSDVGCFGFVLCY